MVSILSALSIVTAELQAPGTDRALARSSRGLAYQSAATNLVTMADLPNVGGSQAHNNMQPYLAINFIIALQGLYPSRS